MLVERLQDSHVEIAKQALQQLVQEVKSATTTVTSVPKSLKFLKPHYQTIKDYFGKITDTEFKVLFKSLFINALENLC
jgi:26S proteasome regulatory complex component